MIAIPITEQHATTISSQSNKASFFAMLDPIDGYFNVIANTAKENLAQCVELLKNEGADAAVFYETAPEILTVFQNEGIPVYQAKEDDRSIDDIFEAFNKKTLS